MRWGSDSWTQGTVSSLTETLVTQNNPGWKERNSDKGGFFSQLTSGFTAQPSRTLHIELGVSPSIGGTYDGVMIADGQGVAPTPTGDGTAFGAVAYNAMKPTKYDYSLFNMVYELKDLGHMLHSAQGVWDQAMRFDPRGAAKRLSDRFLENVFGWIPMIDDAITLVTKQQRIQQRIEWLIRNQGKWVPRTYSRPVSSTITSTDWSQAYGAARPVLVTQFYNSIPEWRDTVMQTDEVWATAQFRYFLPTVPPGVELSFALKRWMQGFRAPSAADLYRAIGWTWLIDWCFGTARLLENMDPGVADRSASRRYFIMRQQQSIVRRTVRFRLNDYRGPVPVECESLNFKILKTRVRGQPFYPGNPNNLTGMQFAILGALGISRYG